MRYFILLLCTLLSSCKPSEKILAQEVLVFSKTVGFRHKNIDAGKEALKKIAEQNNWTITFSEKASIFNEESLKNVKVIIFLSTTGNILNTWQQSSFMDFIQKGGAYVGIHAASSTESDWAWYGQLVGAYFKNHPDIQKATINIVDQNHPSTEHLDKTWRRTDEWYNFKNVLDEKKYHILANVDESSYEGGIMGEKHPISWCHEFEGGRAFYTALGHTKASFQEEKFLKHIEGAIIWAMDNE